MEALNCWYCCGADAGVLPYAYVENGHHAFDAHPSCVKHAGHTEALRRQDEPRDAER